MSNTTNNTQFPAWYKGEGYYLALADGNYEQIDNVEEYVLNGDTLVRRIGHKSDDNLSYFDNDSVKELF